MSEQEFCQSCGQKHNCKSVYQHLGNAKGPPVTMKVVVAFLLPMLIFIIALAGFERSLAKIAGLNQIHTILSFVLAFSITIIFVIVGSFLLNRRGIKSNYK